MSLPTYYIVAYRSFAKSCIMMGKFGYRSSKEKFIKSIENTGERFWRRSKRVLIGTYVLSSGYYDAYYLKAQKVRKLIKKDFENSLKSWRNFNPIYPAQLLKLGKKLVVNICILTICYRTCKFSRSTGYIFTCWSGH